MCMCIYIYIYIYMYSQSQSAELPAQEVAAAPPRLSLPIGDRKAALKCYIYIYTHTMIYIYNFICIS